MPSLDFSSNRLRDSKPRPPLGEDLQEFPGEHRAIPPNSIAQHRNLGKRSARGLARPTRPHLAPHKRNPAFSPFADPSKVRKSRPLLVPHSRTSAGIAHPLPALPPPCALPWCADLRSSRWFATSPRPKDQGRRPADPADHRTREPLPVRIEVDPDFPFKAGGPRCPRRRTGPLPVHRPDPRSRLAPGHVRPSRPVGEAAQTANVKISTCSPGGRTGKFSTLTAKAPCGREAGTGTTRHRRRCHRDQDTPKSSQRPPGRFPTSRRAHGNSAATRPRT